MKKSRFNIANGGVANELLEGTMAVKTDGLMMLLQSGRRTAVEIGTAAGARIQVGKSVLWNVSRVREYLDAISE